MGRPSPLTIRRDADRAGAMLAMTLGSAVRDARRAARLSLAALAERIGIGPARLSQIEHGRGRGAPLDLWIRLGLALDRPLAVSFSRPLIDAASVRDAGHLEIQEHVLALAAATGRRGTFELPTHPSDPRRSTDVGIRDDPNRVLIQVECWNTFGDLGEAARSTKRKQAEGAAHAVATIRGEAEAYRVATVWIVRASAANRAMIARYPHILASAFPGSSRAWVRALTLGHRPPTEPGLVWFDPGRRVLTEWRRRG